ncbi:ESX-1 secretion-associated protein [Mycobacterium haemophilum]
MGNLLVETDHLRELAGKHDRSSADLRTAAETTAAVDQLVRRNHGSICEATTIAVIQVQAARSAATMSMQSVSTNLANRSRTAADTYDRTDDEASENLQRSTTPKKPPASSGSGHEHTALVAPTGNDESPRHGSPEDLATSEAPQTPDAPKLEFTMDKLIGFMDKLNTFSGQVAQLSTDAHQHVSLLNQLFGSLKELLDSIEKMIRLFVEAATGTGGSSGGSFSTGHSLGSYSTTESAGLETLSRTPSQHGGAGTYSGVESQSLGRTPDRGGEVREAGMGTEGGGRAPIDVTNVGPKETQVERVSNEGPPVSGTPRSMPRPSPTHTQPKS